MLPLQASTSLPSPLPVQNISLATDPLVQASLPIPPEVGSVVVGAATSTAATMDLSAYSERFVTLQADGANIYVLFGDGTVPASDTATSGSGVCPFIPQNEERQYFLRAGGKTKVSYKTASGSTGVLRAFVSSAQSLTVE